MSKDPQAVDSRSSRAGHVGAGQAVSGAAVEVAVVALWRSSASGAAELLVGRRAKDAIRGGLWELAGGKIDAGEDPAAAALRELDEEVGVSRDQLAAPCEPLLVVTHTDEGLSRERTVRIHAFIAEALPSASPVARGTAEVRWLALSDFLALEFPKANTAINHAIARRLSGASR